MRNQKKHTLKSIALEMGVSVATISFILNDKAEEKGISSKLIEKVKKYCDEVGYRPNPLAQTLRTGKSQVIVVILENIYSRLARIIEEIAYQKGYQVIFCSNNNRDDKTKKLINLFKDRKVDGFIIAPSPNLESEIKKLAEDQFPLVLVDRYFEGVEANHVITDNTLTAETVTEKLVQQGFKKILFIVPESTQSQISGRLKGYKNVIAKHSLQEHIEILPFEDKSLREENNILKEIISKNDYDAIFFATGYYARLGLEIIKSNFPEYLEDKGIYSYDDEILFKLFTPSISAVYQPLELIGQKLMEILLKEIDSKEELPKLKEKVVLECEFRDRESSLNKVSITPQ
ncbi:LacI family DNA-binding transcriptional regulator [Mesonia sp.]|uniref:LacI family DNA-binding transcriptional regulator n=1 Tax=Mesonia sp. TaxID=1960830 RepID=UPI001757BD77|nr:LacI family DNA-binding transcriptional regulator [Mesonia sp.]HIB37415.1 LacI family transcriptional regulator [Mesonia sp.]HIO27424.1 LacI family transcriptional regulator [Flavobacteriaceae bacterium]